MDSGAEFPDPSAVLERLINSRNRDLALFLPFILALTNPPNPLNLDENSTSPDQESQNDSQPIRERLILINPMTQSMLVIEGSSNSSSSDSGIDSLIRELLLSKAGQPPASKASMETMPEVKIGEECEECVICLEEWEVGGVGKEMPCKHRFHAGCIEKWLRIHGTCPVCRYKMPAEESDDGSRKSEENGGGRRRGIRMSFSFGDDSGRSGAEGYQTESSTESGDDSSTPLSGTDPDREEE